MALSPSLLRIAKQSSTGLLACFGWAACTSTPAATDCRRFETGNFIARHLDPEQGFFYLISRQHGVQIETDQQTGDVSKLVIKWTAPCAYELRLLSSTKHYSPAIETMRKNSALHVEILSYTDTYCIFRSQRESDDPAITDTLWIKK